MAADVTPLTDAQGQAIADALPKQPKAEPNPVVVNDATLSSEALKDGSVRQIVDFYMDDDFNESNGQLQGTLSGILSGDKITEPKLTFEAKNMSCDDANKGKANCRFLERLNHENNAGNINVNALWRNLKLSPPKAPPPLQFEDGSFAEKLRGKNVLRIKATTNRQADLFLKIKESGGDRVVKADRPIPQAPEQADHPIDFKGMIPNTDYDYLIYTRDPAGTVIEGPKGSFRTEPADKPTAPPRLIGCELLMKGRPVPAKTKEPAFNNDALALQCRPDQDDVEARVSIESLTGGTKLTLPDEVAEKLIGKRRESWEIFPQGQAGKAVGDNPGLYKLTVTVGEGSPVQVISRVIWLGPRSQAPKPPRDDFGDARKPN